MTFYPFAWSSNGHQDNRITVYCQPATSPAILGTFLSLNISTDLYLMFIPIPIVFEGHMKTRVKIGLCFLFCCALFIIAAASIRVALIVEVRY